MATLLKPVLAAAGLLAAAACAQPAMYQPGPPDLAGLDLSRGPAPWLRNAVTVGSVSLGRDTGNPWRANVSPAEFQQALVQTLAAAGLGAPQGGRYRLDAVLLTLQRPYAGFAMTVSAQVAYRLTDVATAAVLFTSTPTTLGTATLDDAVTNEMRLKIADERAVRANLRSLVEQLYALPEPAPGRPGRS